MRLRGALELDPPAVALDPVVRHEPGAVGNLEIADTQRRVLHRVELEAEVPADLLLDPLDVVHPTGAGRRSDLPSRPSASHRR